MSMMIAAMNYTHAILLLSSNPVSGWVTWHGSTQRDDSSNFATVATPHQPFDPDQNKIPENHTASSAGGPIDISRLLNLSARTPGVAQVPGPISNVPAFKSRPGFGLVQVPNPSAVTSASSSSAGFTLVFVYRQHRKSLGTSSSVHAPGRVTPYFQVASNLRTGQLVSHYRSTTDAKLHQNAWSLRPAAQYVNSARPNSIASEPVRRPGGSGWTFVHLSSNTSTNMSRSQLDCQPAREQSVAGSGGRGGGGGGLVPHMHVPDDALVYFRQEPGFKKKFSGSMQVAKVYPYATTQHSDWTCDGYRSVRQTQ